MCIDDWRIGALSSFQAYTYSSLLGTGLTIPANSGRAGLMITCGNVASGAQAQVKLGTTQVVVLALGQSQVIWDLRNTGEWCRQAFTIASLAGNVTGVWVEFYLPMDYLLQKIDTYKGNFSP